MAPQLSSGAHVMVSKGKTHGGAHFMVHLSGSYPPPTHSPCVLGFRTDPNALDCWFECALVLDSDGEHFWVMDQVGLMIIQASITIHRAKGVGPEVGPPSTGTQLRGSQYVFVEIYMIYFSSNYLNVIVRVL